MLTASAYHDALERDATAFIDLLQAADPRAPVPACPGWCLADLGRHLGSVHRWARDAILSGHAGVAPSGPKDVPALAAWLRQGVDALIATLRDTDPEAPTWTFGPPPRQVSFWGRRLAHETAIHLVDAQQSGGLPVRMDPALAADGVLEVATILFPRQVRLGHIAPLERGLRVVLSDTPGDAVILGGDGTDPDAPTEATVTGPAADVLLVLWGRAALETLLVEGDADVAAAVLASGITP